MSQKNVPSCPVECFFSFSLFFRCSFFYSLSYQRRHILIESLARLCVCIYLALWGLGPNRSALLVWEQQYAEWSSLLSLTTPISKICVALAWVSCVFASHASDLDGAHVILPGADEQDLARNSEAGSDGWGVLSQTEAGQHGGDANQLTPAGFDRHKAEQSWGTQSQQTCFQTHSSLWSRMENLYDVCVSWAISQDPCHTCLSGSFPFCVHIDVL